MAPVPFRKMHGLGNDFVVLDARAGGFGIGPSEARALADRHTGIGCDQVILLRPPRLDEADLDLVFYNSDGSLSGACGNGTRCVGSLVLAELDRESVVIGTASGLLRCSVDLAGTVTVDMGPAHTEWDRVPLARAADTLRVATGIAELADAVCCSIGNPHATFLVADADAIDLARLGPVLEHLPIFPERANIGVASPLGADRLRLRVWERGAGATLACGSGACAAAVAAARRGVTGRTVELVMERGSLIAEWRADGHVLLSGPVATSFTGSLDRSWFAVP
jgi:diaminopimelate epimerase